MSSTSDLSSIPEVLGGMIIGIGFGLILYGVTLAQSYVYMLNSSNDLQWMKWTVVAVLFLETLHTGFVFRELYHYSVSAIQNPLVIDQIDWYVSSTLSSLCIRR
ncbi:hypothetical protein QCA50_015168 [Cerrena zonata]|uniref:Uncharacterized protein n=1 Tax=Cerrena zonata TaxID=2478898 RepID=A0AAW0FM13_9APHY